MPSPPRLLVIGAGRFGRQHLAEAMALADAGLVRLAGIVVQTTAHAAALRQQFPFPVFTDLDAALAPGVDAADIVTPPDTHAGLVLRCLPHAHVLVEKPLATSEADCDRIAAAVRAHRRVLMVGHVFRFHPAVLRLRERVLAAAGQPLEVHVRMTNPASDRAGRGEAGLEFLHVFDIVEFLFGERAVAAAWASVRDGLHHVGLRLAGAPSARLTFGWHGATRTRTVEVVYADHHIHCDLTDGILAVHRAGDQFEKEFLPVQPVALRAELRAFLARVATARDHPAAAAAGDAPASVAAGADTGGSVDAATARRIVATALRARPARHRDRPRIAVIGGGVFGLAAAVELAALGDVTIFERNADVMAEASFANQWRHHGGFHYPRSPDQVREIVDCRPAFEAEYGAAIQRTHPAWFCTSAHGRVIPRERYLAACRANGLDFTIEPPPADAVDAREVSACVRVDEGVYDFLRLRALMRDRVLADPRIALRLHRTVAGAAIGSDGVKLLRVHAPGPAGAAAAAAGTAAGGDACERFDYVVNATYANLNRLPHWLGFPLLPLRFHFDELLLVRLPLRQMSVSIIDGPFTSLVGTGQEGLFILSHAIDSSHSSVITDDGLPPPWPPSRSNRDNMLRHARQYLPVLAHAEVVESRYAFRAVPARAADFDARPTVVVEHGFGCWSVLGGKVLTCVANAREIAAAIRQELAGTPRTGTEGFPG
jgi:predicted dehydrogenase/glycine/D-amino acid oxidase-like deaminating enzyme